MNIRRLPFTTYPPEHSLRKIPSDLSRVSMNRASSDKSLPSRRVGMDSLDDLFESRGSPDHAYRSWRSASEAELVR